MLYFREWLLNENTVAQELKKYDREKVRAIKTAVKELTRIRLGYMELNANEKTFNRFINWVTKTFIKTWPRGTMAMGVAEPADPDKKLQRPKTFDQWWEYHKSLPRLYPGTEFEPGAYDAFLSNHFNNVDSYDDFIAAHKENNEWLSKLNDPSYNLEDLDSDNADWHEELALKAKGGKGARGRNIGIQSGDYHWVSLDKDYCKQEGEAAGHCGNIGRQYGDNIYSLRTKDDKVYATFVINQHGDLKEGKGRFNKPPEKKLHPAIIQFLLSHHVNKISQSGSYIELKSGINNFHISDLSPSQRKKVLSAKPSIDDEERGVRNMMRRLARMLDTVMEGKKVIDDNIASFDTGVDAALSLGMVNEVQSIYKAGTATKGKWSAGEVGTLVPDIPEGWKWFVDKLGYYFIQKAYVNDQGYTQILLNKPVPKEGIDESVIQLHKNLKKYAPWMWEEW